ncbi:hypothetical protein SEA_JUMBO_67 [Gordonia phage Jumbo]|uniref:Uncharacterized protein n=1 Tax=Gordonia phage Jumbo TaxID=1887650 RepID=A0A1B3B0N9_9CAUD|nr:hypothetical protein BIZ69_gp067 [Gordonia phage Jumbo]AOE44575.1 hypothetical protein SEA_JUMBO_67 [Gordonia phage Jumbo]
MTEPFEYNPYDPESRKSAREWLDKEIKFAKKSVKEIDESLGIERACIRFTVIFGIIALLVNIKFSWWQWWEPVYFIGAILIILSTSVRRLSKAKITAGKLVIILDALKDQIKWG